MHQCVGAIAAWGGILVKEMLVKSLAPGAPAEHARLARATRGLAFYATPHHGLLVGRRWVESALFGRLTCRLSGSPEAGTSARGGTSLRHLL